MTSGESVYPCTVLVFQGNATSTSTNIHAPATCHRFSRDTGYVLPVFFVDTTDQDRVKFSIVISSENLLLNLYRAYKSPRHMTLALDHTYRLVTDDHPTLWIGVASPGKIPPTIVLVPVRTQSHVSFHTTSDFHPIHTSTSLLLPFHTVKRKSPLSRHWRWSNKKCTGLWSSDHKTTWSFDQFRSPHNMLMWQTTHAFTRQLQSEFCSWLTSENLQSHIPNFHTDTYPPPAWMSGISVTVASVTKYEWCLPFNTVIKNWWFRCDIFYPRVSPCFSLFPINYFVPLSKVCQDLQQCWSINKARKQSLPCSFWRWLPSLNGGWHVSFRVYQMHGKVILF
jgi:hypothetical protein